MINLDSKKRRKAPEPDKIETIEQIDLAGFATKHPLKILVAEDNEINQQVITELLAHLGYITGIAENGGEALDRCSREKYDIVLMDIHMPVMDGRKATLKIRKQVPPDQQPVIIAVTASATVEDRKKCLDAGVDLFLAKPIKMQDLMNILIDAWILASGKNNAPDQV